MSGQVVTCQQATQSSLVCRSGKTACRMKFSMRSFRRGVVYLQNFLLLDLIRIEWLSWQSFYENPLSNLARLDMSLEASKPIFATLASSGGSSNSTFPSELVLAITIPDLKDGHCLRCRKARQDRTLRFESSHFCCLEVCNDYNFPPRTL